MQFGVDALCQQKPLQQQLAGRRLGLLAHPASMTYDFVHSLDRLMQCPVLNITAALGPQHGIRGEKQDNMMETEDFMDPLYQIPVFSLYGSVRRPTPKMMEHFDVFLIDLQDIGTRVYTYLTTLFYVLEAAEEYGKAVWILDRPNPIGRPTEGFCLIPTQWSSFVGAAELPMRHGLTLGEAARWFTKMRGLKCEIEVVPMTGYTPHQGPGFGWPLGEVPWINPSPNAGSLSMARCYPGTVLLEGTHLSEGRGTTHPLELFGAPDLNSLQILKMMEVLSEPWMRGCRLRTCYFQPTFHKYADQLCSGIQIHVDDTHYRHLEFHPFRLIALAFKAIRTLYADYPLWRDFHYEYEKDRLAIDLINGGPQLREWVDDPQATTGDLDQLLQKDEEAWQDSQSAHWLYAGSATQ